MSTTQKLLRVFRVDQQLRGLQSRLHTAERFLSEQTNQIAGIDARRDAILSQIRQLQVAAAGHEGEMQRLDARIAQIDAQMASLKTNKEYKAFLTEKNTFKAERSQAESAALESMAKVDELKVQLADLDKQKAEREKVRKVAADERATRVDEIKDRVAELQADRDRLAAQVPRDVLSVYADLLRKKGDEAMAPLEEQDRKRHEYTCGSCQMNLPMETVNALLMSGASATGITRCVSCSCILFIDEELAQSIKQPPPSKRVKGGVSSVE